MRAVVRPSLFYNFQKEIESMIMFFCNQQMTSTQKKRNDKDIFMQSLHNLSTCQEKDLKQRVGMCISESDRPPYLNSFLVTSPSERIRNENDQKMFLANVTSNLCARYGTIHQSSSQLVIWLSLE